MIRAATYKRVSTADQDEDNQDPGIKAYIKERGWRITAEYADHGISAFKEDVKRPGFERMIEDAKAGRFDAIVVFNLDRFSRQDPIQVIKLIKILKLEYGVEVHSVKDDPLRSVIRRIHRMSKGDPIGEAISRFLDEIIIAIEAKRANMESQTKSAQIKAGIENSPKQSGRPKIKDVTTRKLVELYEKGHEGNQNQAMSYRDISKFLKKEYNIKIGYGTVYNRIQEHYIKQQTKGERTVA